MMNGKTESKIDGVVNFQSKADGVLISELKTLVAREREVTTQVLHYLREVELRKIHLERGYPSLFEFTVRELGYSSGSAYRRIQAMRLLKALPELEPQIQSGVLSLSVAAKAQSYFREESKRRRIDAREKKETVRGLLGLSSRECERKLAALSPEAALPKERARSVTDELTQIQFLADRALLGKLERLKQLMAHRNFEGSYAKLFDQLADLALKKLEPKARAVTSTQNEAVSREERVKEEANEDPKENLKRSLKRNPKGITREKLRRSAKRSVRASRFIPAAMKRAVSSRDHGACCFKDRKTGKTCGSRHALEFDHVLPLSLGGATTAENLRLLCASHHRLETEKLALIS
jgi:5-methylcytosine-specific restriction endonuclease McrA